MLNEGNIGKERYWDRALSWVEGCKPVSIGCLNCWSASQAYMRAYQKNPKIRLRYGGLTTIRDERPTFNGKIRLMWEDLERPFKVKTSTVWSIWNDFMLASAKFIDEALDVMGACPEHTFLILTKRPELLESKIYDSTPHIPVRHLGPGDHLPNVYWGVTVEHQDYIHRIEDLLKIPGKHFVSIEPMLGPINLDFFRCVHGQIFSKKPTQNTCWCSDQEKHLTKWDCEITPICGLDGVILGGESGPKARPMHPDWARSVRDQCEKAGIDYFFKQWGEYAESIPFDGYSACRHVYAHDTAFYRVGKKAAGRLLDGREWNELPWRN